MGLPERPPLRRQDDMIKLACILVKVLIRRRRRKRR